MKKPCAAVHPFRRNVSRQVSSSTPSATTVRPSWAANPRLKSTTAAAAGSAAMACTNDMSIFSAVSGKVVRYPTDA